VREYPQAEGDPYYPIPTDANEALYQRYAALAEQEPNVTFVGRLAQYRYYNMDQVVAAALRAAERVIAKLGGG
jgi:UDP-galactopyranose mutase